MTREQYYEQSWMLFPAIEQAFLRICYVDAMLKRDDAQLCYPYTPKSAPVLRAAHNSGEGDPSVMADCAGADTQKSYPYTPKENDHD